MIELSGLAKMFAEEIIGHNERARTMYCQFCGQIHKRVEAGGLIVYVPHHMDNCAVKKAVEYLESIND